MISRILIKMMACAALVFIGGGCAPSRKNVIPLDRGGLSSSFTHEEQELRAETEKYQQYLESQHMLFRDEAVRSYVESVARPFIEALNVQDKADFKIQILRDPTLNAFALPTGGIYFHTGLLARTYDEDQLAFVMAHEISHVYHRDSLYQSVNFERKTVGFKIADILLGGAATVFGMPGVSSTLLSLMYVGSVQGYGREAEAAADAFALEQIVKAGYDPAKAVKFFDLMLADHEKYERGLEVFFLSSHPSNKARKEYVLKWAAEHKKDVRLSHPTKTADFIAKTFSLRLQNVKLNMDFHRYFHALEILSELEKYQPDSPEIYFYRGEIFRRLPGQRLKIKEELSRKEWGKIAKGKDKEKDAAWIKESLTWYQKSLAKSDAFGPAHKGIGEWYFENKDYEKATLHFNRYLELEPDARDRRSVLRYLKDMETHKVSGVKA